MSRAKWAKSMWWSGMALAFAGAALLTVSQRATRGQAARRATAPADQAAWAAWRDLAPELPPALARSRVFLLGDRTLDGRTCIAFQMDGRNLHRPAHPRGGMGTKLAYTWLSETRSRTPSEDLAWHQGPLRQEIERLRAANQQILPPMARQAEKAEALAAALARATSWPSDLRPSGVDAGGSWPAYCLKSLDAAAVRRDLPAARLAAEELAAALFGLADLHRWLDLQTRVHLAALDFQARSAELFRASDPFYADRYRPISAAASFPAGMLAELDNYYEIERQAEWTFATRDEFLTLTPAGMEQVRRPTGSAGTGAVWMPPNLRASFLRLRAALSRDNRAVWDAAARTPYERAYLVSMLHRTAKTGQIDSLAALLSRFSRRRPEAAMDELMDAIFRGGDALDMADWGARYHPTLIERAGALKGPDDEVLMEAHQVTGALWLGWEGYRAMPSVRAALETGRMDCCMASTLIGNLYRNAGGTGGCLLRGSGGIAGHTLAAAEIGAGAQRRVLVVDGLDRAQQAPLLWPEDFVRGRPWPDGYPDATPPFFAFELYGRGLDNFIWLEGLIVAGRNAGLTIRADVPYLPGRDRRGRPDPDTATAGRGWGRTVANPASGSPTVR